MLNGLSLQACVSPIQAETNTGSPAVSPVIRLSRSAYTDNCVQFGSHLAIPFYRSTESPCRRGLIFPIF